MGFPVCVQPSIEWPCCPASSPTVHRPWYCELLLLITAAATTVTTPSTTTAHRLVGLVVKASASRAEGPGFESRLRWDFFGVKSYQWLKNWHSSGYPARRLALWGQRWDWSARCQYTVTGWDGKFDLQLLSQCGSTSNCLCRSVPEIHLHVAGTLSSQPTNILLLLLPPPLQYYHNHHYYYYNCYCPH